MIWGTFSTNHLISLAVGVVIIFALYIALMDSTRKKQILVLFSFSLIGIVSIIYDLIAYGNPMEHLPLSLSALNALLLPYAVLTRRKWCCNYLLVSSIGSYFSLICNYSMADKEIFSIPVILYFLSNVMSAGIPILLFKHELVKRETKTIVSSISLLLDVYIIVHVINVLINTANMTNNLGEVISVNYMSTLAPTNPVLDFCHVIFPHSFWYMAVTLPIIILYALWWYLPELLEEYKVIKERNEKRKAIKMYYRIYEKEYIDEIIEKKYK